MANNVRKAKLLDGSETVIKGVVEVDPDTYEIRNRYYSSGKECKKVTLVSRQAKNFASYALIKKDLKFVRKAFSIARDKVGRVDVDGVRVTYRPENDEDSEIVKSLFISGVVTYAKCFTKADGRKVKLEACDIFGSEDSDKRELHIDLMDQRHNYLAHGGNTKHEHVNAVLVLDPNSNNTPPALLTEVTHTSHWSSQDFFDFLSLAIFVDDKLDGILRKKSNALYNQEIKKTPNQDWHDIAD